VAAVRGDDGLQACPVLETCLAEVATGVAPHVEAAELTACAAYRERLHGWAQQESEGGGQDALERAVAQAMKATVASVSAPPQPAAGRSAASAATAVPSAVPAAAPSSAAGGRRSWLPQAFIREFNAEGEEVEPEVSQQEPPAPVPALARIPSDKGGSGRRSGARVVVKASPELLS